MMGRAIVLMTAMPPTIGHAQLIKFALAQRVSTVHVIVTTRSFEPISGRLRAAALAEHFRRDKQVYIHEHLDDKAFQNPNDAPDADTFWNYWVSVAQCYMGNIRPNDVVVTSEAYGLEYAKRLNCRFLPYDLDRTIIDAKATTVRKNIDWFSATELNVFKLMIPEMRRHCRTRVTFFGAESCGKTTMTFKLGSPYLMNAICIPEYARSYVESLGDNTLTEDVMRSIMEGQNAYQTMDFDNDERMLIFQDTDLYSTIGYYGINGMPLPPQIEPWAQVSESDLYIVMNDRIPFTPDHMRYGGDKREADTQYWLDVLAKYNVPQNKIYQVQDTSHNDQINELFYFLTEYQSKKFESWRTFERT